MLSVYHHRVCHFVLTEMDVVEFYQRSKNDRLLLKVTGNSGVFSRLTFNVLKFTVYGIVLLQILQTVADVITAYRTLIYNWGSPLVLDDRFAHSISALLPLFDGLSERQSINVLF